MQGVKTAKMTFSMLAHALPKLTLNEDKIALELEEGYACATELADLFAKKGVPFRKAHEITGGIVRDCMAKKKFLSALTAQEVSSLAGVPIPQKELAEAVSVDKVARFASQYKIPADSAHAKELAARKKALADASSLLEKEAASLAG